MREDDRRKRGTLYITTTPRKVWWAQPPPTPQNEFEDVVGQNQAGAEENTSVHGLRATSEEFVPYKKGGLAQFLELQVCCMCCGGQEGWVSLCVIVCCAGQKKDG